MSLAKAHHDGADSACARVAESLPFLLNDSLDEGERRDVLDHLRACQACQTDLEDTAFAWVSAGSHPPAQTLADYGLGLKLVGFPRDLLEGHLATCPICAAALEPLLGDPEFGIGSDADAAEIDTAFDAVSGEHQRESRLAEASPRRAQGVSREPVWRQLAAAASFLTVILSATLLWQLFDQQLPEQGGAVQIVELQPMDARYRGGDAASGSAFDPTRSVALVLVPAETPTSNTFRARLLDEDNVTLHQFDGLALSATGDIALLLPLGMVGAEPLRLVLEEPRASSGEAASEWRMLGRYLVPGAP